MTIPDLENLQGRVEKLEAARSFHLKIMAGAGVLLLCLFLVAWYQLRREGIPSTWIKPGKVEDDIAGLNGALKDLTRRLATAEAQLIAARDKESTNFARRGSWPGAPSKGQAERTVPKGHLSENYAKCPAGYFIVSLQLLKVGNDVAEFWYDCRRVFD